MTALSRFGRTCPEVQEIQRKRGLLLFATFAPSHDATSLLIVRLSCIGLPRIDLLNMVDHPQPTNNTHG